MVVPSIHVKGSKDDHEGNVKNAFSQAANLSYDIEIIASGGERLATNRFILSIFSPFLQSLLKENRGVSTTLHLPDCSLRSLKHLLSLFTGGISLINFFEINDLNETAKLLLVDLKNISFLHQNSFESQDNKDKIKNKTIVTEGLLDKNSEFKKAPTSDAKRCGQLSFEKNPSTLKQLKIYDRNFMKQEPNNKVCMLYKNENECKNSLELKNLKCENHHIPEKSKQSEDSGYKSDQTSSLMKENDFNFPKSPQKQLRNKKTLSCTKKGRNNSFCKIHMKVHTVKKVFENNEPKLTGKFRRKLLNNKDSKYDWKDDVCNISFNTRVKLRDHRREVKCKQRDKKAQKSIDLHFLEDQSHDSVKENKIHLPILEESSQFSKVNNMNDYMELDLITSGRNLQISEDISQESFQCGEFTDSSSLFSSLMHNPFISSKEEESPKNARKLSGNETIQTKGETFKKDSWNSGTPRRLAVSELKSSDLPSTSKDMSPFESRHNTSPTRKKLILKCCPKSSTLNKCCLKLDK